MHYEIAVCDDSEADRRYLSGQVSHWAREAGHTAEIVAFDSAESFLFRYAEKNDYDILLLDIEMGEMDGVTMAKTLRRGNDTVQIVFITGYSEYIAEGYEVDALHYLMKPGGQAVFGSRPGDGKTEKEREDAQRGVGRRTIPDSGASDPVCRSVRQLCDHSRLAGADR